MAMVIERALAGAGFSTATAGTGERALAELAASRFALAILDLLLPDIDGLAVLARAAVVAPHVPILVLSAVTDVRSKVVCLDLGACDYVAKPCQLPELLARVRLRLRANGTPNHRREVRSGRHVLDLQRRIVANGDRSVPLTTREFLLLQYLMERVGQTCSRAQLLESVWGYGFDPGTNVVDVCVARLRHKLGADCVMTIRNVGYSFVGA
jgi:DNA-binding response OmpR family regulator